MFRKINDAEDIVNARSILTIKTRNLPVDLSDCETVGMYCGCHKDCPVLNRGDCEVEKEVLLKFKEQLNADNERK